MKTILIVDDEFEVAQSIESILEDEGYQVLTAGDGLEAMEVLKDKIPHLIISDVMMPLCNGLQLLEKIRGDERYKEIPVVFMSAVHHEKFSLVQGYLKKPFNLDTLLLTVENLIGKNS